MRLTLRTSGGQEIVYDQDLGGFDRQGTLCFQCGECCSRWQAPLDSGEIELIASRLSIPVERFIADYLRRYPIGDSYLIAHKDGACVFLRADGGRWLCSIHDFKPQACRAWTPGLARRECRQGLKKLGAESGLVRPDDFNLTARQIAEISRSLRDQVQS